MTAELGHFSLILALCFAGLQFLLPFVDMWRKNTLCFNACQASSFGQLIFIGLSFFTLMYCFGTNDFSVNYVVSHSNQYLPWYYRLSAVWGGHEGSMLLWVFILAGWNACVAKFSRCLPHELRSRMLMVLGLISCGLLVFILETSNPFSRIWPPLADGQDLNPLLQDFGLIIHPPMLYMGYVGCAVVFAFACAVLLLGQIKSEWLRWARPWTTAAWCFLTLGIALGSWWAYYELGWGGWWFWDPVENASLMPWIIVTALLHSLAVSEKRKLFYHWTLLLALFSFSLSLLGTFLVRSGVLVSVHAFANDPERGVFILVMISVVVGAALALYAWRASKLDSDGHFSWLSRETFILINNALLIIAGLTVLLGTLAPLIFEALDWGKISVGPPYFNAFVVPIGLILLLFLTIGPLLNWQKHSVATLFTRLRPVMLIAVLGLLAFCLLFFKTFSAVELACLTLAGWVVLSTFWHIFHQVRHAQSVRIGLGSISLSQYGMWTAHIGLVILTVGICVSNALNLRQEVKMTPGESVSVGHYQFTLEKVEPVTGQNYRSLQGRFNVYKDEKLVTTVLPQKRFYWVQQSSMTEAGISAGLWRDIYVSLGEPLDGDAWVVMLSVKPLVRWIWLGALIMVLGGLLTLFDRRYRQKAQPTSIQDSTS